MESSRRRRPRTPSPEYKLDDEDDDYQPYIPVAQRRQQKLAKLSSLGMTTEKPKQEDDADEIEDAQREEELRREKARKERTLLLEAQEVQQRKAAAGESHPSMVLQCTTNTLTVL